MGKSIGEKIYGVADERDALTISYMMGAESRNEVIQSLNKRIEELEAEEAELKAKIEKIDAEIAEYKKDNSEQLDELMKWKHGEYRP